MSSFFGFIIILFIIFLLCRRWIYPWLAKRAQNRMEDYFRKAMGMPSRKEEQKMRRNYADDNKRNSRSSRRKNHNSKHPNSDEPIIPKEYAVDVEFTEIKEFSQSEIPDPPKNKSYWSKFSSSTSVHIDSQVEDADFTEIKDE